MSAVKALVFTLTIPDRFWDRDLSGIEWEKAEHFLHLAWAFFTFECSAVVVFNPSPGLTGQERQIWLLPVAPRAGWRLRPLIKLLQCSEHSFKPIQD